MDKSHSQITTTIKIGGGFVLEGPYSIKIELMNINPRLNQAQLFIRLPRFLKFLPVKLFASNVSIETNEKSKKTG